MPSNNRYSVLRDEIQSNTFSAYRNPLTVGQVIASRNGVWSLLSEQGESEDAKIIKKEKKDFIDELVKNKDGSAIEFQKNAMSESPFYFSMAKDSFLSSTNMTIKNIEGTELCVMYHSSYESDGSIPLDYFKQNIFIGVPLYEFKERVLSDSGHWGIELGQREHTFRFKVFGQVDESLIKYRNMCVFDFVENMSFVPSSFKKFNGFYTNIVFCTNKMNKGLLVLQDADTAEFGINGTSHVIALAESIKNIVNYINTNLVQRRQQIQGRKPNTGSKKYFSKKHGDYVKHKIPFAVEIECHGKDEQTVAKMTHEIPKEWGACRDGSLDTDVGFPIEIQSPILVGKKGEENVIGVCNTLNALGITAKDKSCGLHIHLGGKDMFVNDRAVLEGKKKPTNTISLFMFYRLFEDVIVSFLPTTRRQNRYCTTFKKGSEYQGSSRTYKPLDSESFDAISAIKTLKEFELYWYGVSGYNAVRNAKSQRYTVTRYFGANIHSLLKENHFEVRFHSGTLNYEKILYWVNLHGKIVEMCGSGRINLKILRDVFNTCKSFESLNDKFFEILSLDDDTVGYLKHRQEMFKDADKKNIDEIVISKTKTLEII